jgi:hypothetical protein
MPGSADLARRLMFERGRLADAIKGRAQSPATVPPPPVDGPGLTRVVRRPDRAGMAVGDEEALRHPAEQRPDAELGPAIKGRAQSPATVPPPPVDGPGLTPDLGATAAPARKVG